MILLSFIVSSRKVISGNVRSCVEARIDQEVDKGNKKHGSEVYYDFHE